MPAYVATRSGPAGFRSVILENRHLRVAVIPELGSKVHEFVDKAAGRDLLWHNERTPPRAAPYGAHFDDWWSGGWDEIFPTGDRAELHAELLPYMGELWSVPWNVRSDVSNKVASVWTSTFTTMAPARFERRLWLVGDEPVLRAHYRIQNLDVRPLPFLWGIHPAFSVGPGHRIDHPASNMLVGVSSDPSMGEVGESYVWPGRPDPSMPDGRRDMRIVRPRSDAVFGGHWATDLAEGWLALTDTAARRGIALAFSTAVFPHAWLWQVYGGWRGHHHVALEPWTGYPMQLEEAAAAGRAQVLGPGEELNAEVALVLFAGLERVESVEASGSGLRVR